MLMLQAITLILAVMKYTLFFALPIMAGAYLVQSRAKLWHGIGLGWLLATLGYGLTLLSTNTLLVPFAYLTVGSAAIAYTLKTTFLRGIAVTAGVLAVQAVFGMVYVPVVFW